MEDKVLEDSNKNILKKWYDKFKRFKVTYKDGFFNLSNLSNSPQTIVESFDKMPFCKLDREARLLTTDTMFLKGQLYYTKIEDGMWVFISDMWYKKNLRMNNYFDKSLPVQYHFVNLHYRKREFKSKTMLVNGISLTDKVWVAFKAGNAIAEHHFKNSNDLNITIYFTRDWLNKSVEFKENESNKLLDFFDSNSKYILLPDTKIHTSNYYEGLLDLSKSNVNEGNNGKINEIVLEFFKEFVQKLNAQDFSDQHFLLNDKDRKRVIQAENYLKDTLMGNFPGIEYLAKEIGISPTKLKSDFKAIHNKSLYQYYNFHQMQLANELLLKNASTVKEVANLLGYENAGKFSGAFKKQFGFSPSQIISLIEKPELIAEL